MSNTVLCHCDLDFFYIYCTGSQLTIIIAGVPLVSVLDNCVWRISPVLFEVAIPNLLCRYILGLKSITYYFQVPVTLTSTFSSRKVVSGAYLWRIFDNFSVFGVRQNSCLNKHKTSKTRGLEVLPSALMTIKHFSVTYCFWVTLTLTSGLSFRKVLRKVCPMT